MDVPPVKFNSYLDHNEKNFGLAKLRAKYPKEDDEKIYTRFLGHKQKGIEK